MTRLWSFRAAVFERKARPPDEQSLALPAELNFPKKTMWGKQTVTIRGAHGQTGGTAGLDIAVSTSPSPAAAG